MGNFYTPKPNRLHLVIHWIVNVIVMVSMAIFTVHLFGTRVPVIGNSMSPLLNSGDVILMDRLAYDLGTPKRFDIVVFDREKDGSYYIRRVIGLPGETVQIVNGIVYINGEILDAEAPLRTAMIPGNAKEPVELGPNEYFLLGDNRESSEDSRFSGVGNVPAKRIIGRVWLRLQPFEEFGLIDFGGTE